MHADAPAATRSSRQASGPQGFAGRWRRFVLQAEDGTQALEELLLIAFIVVPCCWATLMLQDVLREFLGFETVLLTSPFF